ncbi:MAG: PhoH family protein [Thermodesulfobacteriota bacterium]
MKTISAPASGLKQEEQREQITLEDNAIAMSLFGEAASNLKTIQKCMGVRIDTRGSLLTLRGDTRSVGDVKKLITDLYDLISRGYTLSPHDIDYAIRMVQTDRDVAIADVFLDTACISFKKKVIASKSLAQKRYIDAIRKSDMVFGIGPAGTGKTYLAMAMAVSALLNKEVERIILTRPAVEAGERLGFLPGDLAAKVDPYLRPLYDALYDLLEYERVEKMLERGVIEVAPLAFMRGRTLNDSFIILDEGQNTTIEQMKMFLTRLGFDSKAVITGDITQVDLPSARTSGLIESRDVLSGIKGIEFIFFSDADVVRHPLVQDVIRAFDDVEAGRQVSPAKPSQDPGKEL